MEDYEKHIRASYFRRKCGVMHVLKGDTLLQDGLGAKELGDHVTYFVL